LSGVLLISASHASRGIFTKFGRNAVAKVKIMQALCTYSSISLLNSHALAQQRLARHQRRIRGSIGPIIENERGLDDRLAVVHQRRHDAAGIKLAIGRIVLIAAQCQEMLFGVETFLLERDAHLLSADRIECSSTRSSPKHIAAAILMFPAPGVE